MNFKSIIIFSTNQIHLNYYQLNIVWSFDWNHVLIDHHELNPNVLISIDQELNRRFVIFHWFSSSFLIVQLEENQSENIAEFNFFRRKEKHWRVSEESVDWNTSVSVPVWTRIKCEQSLTSIVWKTNGLTVVIQTTDGVVTKN